MSTEPAAKDASPSVIAPLIPLADLSDFCERVLRAVGTDEATANAVTRAMMHASRLGVDSHGVRLLAHYVREFEGGRVHKSPTITITRRFASTATLDAGHGHGAVAAYAAADLAVSMADTHGIGAVGIQRSGHFGAAGAFAKGIADAGMIGFVTCNAGPNAALHDGAAAIHGTNPLAWAFPLPEGPPWLLDMATSAIPLNRVFLYRSTGDTLPEGVALSSSGEATRDADVAEMLRPLGGDFSYKGAGLAGLAEILSAVLPGMQLAHQILSFTGPDFSTPRSLGQFVMALRPDAFVDRATFDAGMTEYLSHLRASATRPGGRVFAPGDREWAVAKLRDEEGFPLDPATTAAFHGFAERFALSLSGLQDG